MFLKTVTPTVLLHYMWCEFITFIDSEWPGTLKTYKTLEETLSEHTTVRAMGQLRRSRRILVLHSLAHQSELWCCPLQDSGVVTAQQRWAGAHPILATLRGASLVKGWRRASNACAITGAREPSANYPSATAWRGCVNMDQAAQTSPEGSSAVVYLVRISWPEMCWSGGWVCFRQRISRSEIGFYNVFGCYAPLRPLVFLEILTKGCSSQWNQHTLCMYRSYDCLTGIHLFDIHTAYISFCTNKVWKIN